MIIVIVFASVMFLSAGAVYVSIDSTVRVHPIEDPYISINGTVTLKDKSVGKYVFASPENTTGAQVFAIDVMIFNRDLGVFKTEGAWAQYMFIGALYSDIYTNLDTYEMQTSAWTLVRTLNKEIDIKVSSNYYIMVRAVFIVMWNRSIVPYSQKDVWGVSLWLPGTLADSDTGSFVQNESDQNLISDRVATYKLRKGTTEISLEKIRLNSYESDLVRVLETEHDDPYTILNRRYPYELYGSASFLGIQWEDVYREAPG